MTIHPRRLPLRNKMACIIEQDVCQVSLLMYNASECAVVTKPGGGRLACEPLDASESSVLDRD